MNEQEQQLDINKENFIIKGELLNNVIQYMLSKPYGEVAHLIQGLQQVQLFKPGLNDDSKQLEPAGVGTKTRKNKSVQNLESKKKN
jgi:hypothetical protein